MKLLWRLIHLWFVLLFLGLLFLLVINYQHSFSLLFCVLKWPLFYVILSLFWHLVTFHFICSFVFLFSWFQFIPPFHRSGKHVCVCRFLSSFFGLLDNMVCFYTFSCSLLGIHRLLIVFADFHSCILLLSLLTLAKMVFLKELLPLAKSSFPAAFLFSFDPWFKDRFDPALKPDSCTHVLSKHF